MRVVHVDSAHEWRGSHRVRFASVAVLGSVLSLGVAEASPLRQLDAELREITARVSPAVVQVLVAGYGAVDAGSPGQAAVVSRQQRLGSGVILDPSGYIMTNAHVIKGAQRVQVVLTKPDRSVDGPPLPGAEQSVLPATVVGFSRPLRPRAAQGGSHRTSHAAPRRLLEGQPGPGRDRHRQPLGLDNSVTMGIVSSTARQAKPDSPVVFVQTDAPINPGNSGGALVDLDGRLVGINTFILSQAGGNEGLGFAIPAPIVASRLRKPAREGPLRPARDRGGRPDHHPRAREGPGLAPGLRPRRMRSRAARPGRGGRLEDRRRHRRRRRPVHTQLRRARGQPLPS